MIPNPKIGFYYPSLGHVMKGIFVSKSVCSAKIMSVHLKWEIILLLYLLYWTFLSCSLLSYGISTLLLFIIAKSLSYYRFLVDSCRSFSLLDLIEISFHYKNEERRQFWLSDNYREGNTGKKQWTNIHKWYTNWRIDIKIDIFSYHKVSESTTI